MDCDYPGRLKLEYCCMPPSGIDSTATFARHGRFCLGPQSAIQATSRFETSKRVSIRTHLLTGWMWCFRDRRIGRAMRARRRAPLSLVAAVTAWDGRCSGAPCGHRTPGRRPARSRSGPRGLMLRVHVMACTSTAFPVGGVMSLGSLVNLRQLRSRQTQNVTPEPPHVLNNEIRRGDQHERDDGRENDAEGERHRHRLEECRIDALIQHERREREERRQ